MPSETEVMHFLEKGILFRVLYREIPVGEGKTGQRGIQVKIRSIAGDELTLRLHEGVIYQGAEKNGKGPIEAGSQEQLEALATRFSDQYLRPMLPRLSKQTMPEEHYDAIARIKRALRYMKVHYDPEPVQSNPSTTT